MFEELVNIICINNYDQSDRKTLASIENNKEKSNDIITRLNSKTIQNILTSITNQKELNNFYVNGYSYNIPTESIIQKDNYDFVDESFNVLNIEYYNNELVFIDILSINDLVNYLYDNISCEYIAFPVYHGSHDKDSMNHISLLLFDNINKLIYHIDSNGVCDENKILEKIAKFHLEMINVYNLNYTFVESENWNCKEVYLNINYQHDELYDKGNCVIWTLLLAKIICETHRMPSDVFDEIEKLDRDEKIFILKEYKNFILKKYFANRFNNINNAKSQKKNLYARKK